MELSGSVAFNQKIVITVVPNNGWPHASKNLVHHLHLGIRQLEELKKGVKLCGVKRSAIWLAILLNTTPTYFTYFTRILV